MSKFTQFNAIKPLPKENLWITTSRLIFFERDDLVWIAHIVPEWFIFDGASVPRVFWIFFTPTQPKTISASCLHDRLWRNKIWFFKSNCLFYKSLVASGNSKLKSFLFYLWVTNPIWYLIYLSK